MPDGDDEDTSRREFDVRWSVWRLLIICVTVLGVIALTIPLAYILADKETQVTVNAAFSFSAVLSVGVALTGTGWFVSARGRRELIRRVHRLQDENRQLQGELEAERRRQPVLNEESAPAKDEQP